MIYVGVGVWGVIYVVLGIYVYLVVMGRFWGGIYREYVSKCIYIFYN